MLLFTNNKIILTIFNDMIHKIDDNVKFIYIDDILNLNVDILIKYF